MGLSSEMEPPGRVFPLLVARGQELYLIGGVDAAGKHFGDVWRFAGRWERLSAASIPVRSGHVGFVFEDHIYVYGGQEEAVPSRIYDQWLRLSLHTLQWEDFAPSGLPARHSCSCVFDEQTAKAYVYGGATSAGIEGDTLVLDVRSAACAVLPTSHKPPGRMMHAAALHSGQMFVLGGIDETQHVSPDLFALSLAEASWRSLGVFVVDGALMKMCGFAMAAEDDTLIVFGGMDLENLTVYNQVFMYDIAQTQWYRVAEQRAPRFGGCIAAQRGEGDTALVIVGGCDMRTKATAGGAENLSVARLQAAKEPL